MIYTVYFELYGKKMKTKVNAENPEQAKAKVLNKIIFHKIERDCSQEFNDIFKPLFDWLDKK